MIEGQIPQELLPPPKAPALPGAQVLASVDKPANQSKSTQLARLALWLTMGVAAIVALGVSAALFKGHAVDLVGAAALMASLAALGAPGAAAAASHRASDSKVRAEALRSPGG